MECLMQKLALVDSRAPESADDADLTEADGDYLDCRESSGCRGDDSRSLLLHSRHFVEEDEDEDEEEEESTDNDTLRTSHDSGSCGQFMLEEDPSEESLPERATSKYAGHPLGEDELEMQEYHVQQYKNSLQEAFMAEFRHQSQWGLKESRARAKILVAEGYFKEKQHVEAQLSHLNEADARCCSPRPVRRFKAHHKFRCAGFHANSREVLADKSRHRDLAERKMATLKQRWGSIMNEVEHDMTSYDNFANVIKNLSTMRIFLEGQQSMSYQVDPHERERRMLMSQSVIHRLYERNDGLFLRDAHPRGEPLN